MKSEKYRKQLELAERYYTLIKKGRNGEIETEEVRQELDKLELQFSLINDPGYEAFLRLNRGDL